MEHLPLSEACLSEVLARVSYRVLCWWYNHAEYDNADPKEIIRGCAYWLAAEGFHVLQTWVLAYDREWSPMTPTKFTRDAFIFRARQGYTWRRVVLPQYKRNRSDPRVTNRGVAREGFAEERPR